MNELADKIFPEIIHNGIDFSLLTQREWQLLKIYDNRRKKLKAKYPCRIGGASDVYNYNSLDDEDGDGYDIDINAAKHDPDSTRFIKALTTTKTLLDKIEDMKDSLTAYELCCVRLYCKYLFNHFNVDLAKTKKRKAEVKQFLASFKHADIYEIVTCYFKIMRKHGLPIYEEPFYWMNPQDKREIQFEGDMLRRTSTYDHTEIHVSLLEAFQ